MSLLGENTCDGKKKAYEILGPLVKDLYVMDLPQTKVRDGEEITQRGIPQVYRKTRKSQREEGNRRSHSKRQLR